MSLFGARAVALIKELRSLAHLPQYNENAIREVVHEISTLHDVLTNMMQYVCVVVFWRARAHGPLEIMPSRPPACPPEIQASTCSNWTTHPALH